MGFLSHSAHRLYVERPDVEPDYPVAGYGISDDVSVMSEMTTPTVVTRQSVEEDEYGDVFPYLSMAAGASPLWYK